MEKIQKDILKTFQVILETKNILKEDNPTLVRMIAPLNRMPSKINHPFGEKRTDEIHPGVDLGAKTGTEVKAIMDGVVERAMCCIKKCGATIDIDYGNGFWSRFCHMSRIDVQEGDVVKQGQVVGLSGGKPGAWGAGNSKGEHLHFTLKKDGRLVDPMDYLDKTVVSGNIETFSDENDPNSINQVPSEEKFELPSDWIGRFFKNITKF